MHKYDLANKHQMGKIMIFNLIVGIIAGIGSRYVEKPLGAIIKDKLDMPEPDLRVLAFVACLLAASFLIGIAGANGLPIILLIGGALGIFGSHVIKFALTQKDALQKKMKERKKTAGSATEVKKTPVKKVTKK